MKLSEIKVNVRLGDVLHAPYSNAWSDMCDKYGFSEWCLNEGQAESDDMIEVTFDDAMRWGLIEYDN